MYSERRQGFTLIELMIVVVIIGILAAIFIPNYVNMQDRARESTVRANAHAVQLVVEDYAVDHNGAYPEDLSAVFPALCNLSNPFGGDAVGDPNPGVCAYTLHNGVYYIDAYAKDGATVILELSNN